MCLGVQVSKNIFLHVYACCWGHASASVEISSSRVSNGASRPLAKGIICDMQYLREKGGEQLASAGTHDSHKCWHLALCVDGRYLFRFERMAWAVLVAPALTHPTSRSINKLATSSYVRSFAHQRVTQHPRKDLGKCISRKCRKYGTLS